MLKVVLKNNLVSNDRFIAREKWANDFALERFHHAEMHRMIDAQLEELIIDENGVRPTEEESNFDWLKQAIP